jgi:hypothetical protein
MAHHSPRATDFWGIPYPFVLRVLISADQYQKTRRELVQRFGTNPIAAENPIEQLRAPKLSDLGPEGTFKWLTENYPFDPAALNVMMQFYSTAKEKKTTLDYARDRFYLSFEGRFNLRELRVNNNVTLLGDGWSVLARTGSEHHLRCSE